MCYCILGQLPLIKPSEKDLIKTWGDLHERNYTLVRTNKDFVYVVGDAKAIKSRAFSAPYHAFLPSLIPNNSEDTDEIPLFADRVFNINFWACALNMPEASQIEIEQRAKTSYEKERVCNAGQELLFPTRNYFAFLPSGNKPLFQAFARIQAARIVDRYTKEFSGMLTSVRVQDRVRVFSKTKRISTKVTSVENLKMQGKIKTVFLLRILCFLGSFGFFLGELSWFHKKRWRILIIQMCGFLRFEAQKKNCTILSLLPCSLGLRVEKYCNFEILEAFLVPRRNAIPCSGFILILKICMLIISDRIVPLLYALFST